MESNPQNQSGFGLIEVIVASGIAAILALAVGSMSSYMFKSNATTRMKYAIDTTHEEIRAALGATVPNSGSSVNGCTASFVKGGVATNSPTTETVLAAGMAVAFTQIVNANDAVLYKADGTKYGNLFSISSITMTQPAAGADSTKMIDNNQVSVDIVYVPAQQTFGAPTITRSILLQGVVDSGNNLKNCSPMAKMSDGLWQRVSALTDIYYTGGKIGVGTSNPTNLLSVVTSNAGNTSPLILAQNTDPSGQTAAFAKNSTGGYVAIQSDGNTFPTGGYGNTAGLNFGNLSRAYIITDEQTNSGGSAPFHIVTGGWQNMPTLTVTAGSPGKVGIGTTTPTDFLHVIGGMTTEWASGNANVVAKGTNDANGTGTFIGLAGTAVTKKGIVQTSLTQMLIGTASDNGSIPLNFQTNSQVRMTIDSPSGYVGIGTTTPGSPLHVQGITSMYTTQNIPELILNRPITASQYNGIQWTTSDTSASWRMGQPMGDGNLEIYGMNGLGSAIYLSGAIDGGVGLGTNTPSAKLDIQTTLGNAVVKLKTNDPGRAGTTAMVLGNNVDDNLSTWEVFGPNWGVAALRGKAFLSAKTNSTGLVLSTLGASPISFNTNAGGGGDANERMRIDSNGNVGIGTTSPGYKFEVIGDINIQGDIMTTNDLHIGGNQVCDNTGCSPRGTYSDARLKKDVRTLDQSLEKILQLRGVSYSWIDSEKYQGQATIGVIAQETEKVYPEVVKTNKSSGFKTVAYDHLVGPIIEAIKSLYSRLVDLEKSFGKLSATSAAQSEELVSLKARAEKAEEENRAMKARLDALEDLMRKK